MFLLSEHPSILLVNPSTFQSMSINLNLGLLILRIGIGTMFMLHGAPKLMGGPEQWEKLGQSMGNLGIDFLPAFWGFMAGFAEFVGGLCLVLGIFWVPACFLLILTMIVAAIMHISQGDGFPRYSHAVESAILFISLIFIGAGQYRLSRRF